MINDGGRQIGDLRIRVRGSFTVGDGAAEAHMTTAQAWFLVIAASAVAAPYLLGVKPRTRRQWLYVAITLAFLAWILPLMVSLRSS